jgi:hypothetical protein
MGFDLSFDLLLHMCDETGKPFYYSRKKFEKLYDISGIIVPQHLRGSLQLRGHFLHIYTRAFNADERFSVEVDEFLDSFPSWEDVESDSCYDDYWTEKDHKNFKELLEWCVKQDMYFRVTWSY